MSQVTNVILTRGLEEVEDLSDFNLHLQAITGDKGHWFRELSTIDHIAVDGMCITGGSKNLEHYVAVSALNYCATADLIKAVETFPWVDPENVRLMVCEQEEDAFSQVWPR